MIQNTSEMRKDINQFAFIGENDSFRETYESEETAIKNAERDYANQDEDTLGFDYEKDEVPSVCSICKVYEFGVNFDLLTKLIKDTILEYIEEEYGDFEAGVDDAEIYVKKGFGDALKELIDKYFSPGGVSQIGEVLYKYDLKNHCKVEESK